MQPVALVVVIDDIPKRRLRAVVKVRSGDQDIADVRCLEGGNVGLFLADQKPAEGREVGLNGGAIYGLRLTGVDQLLGLTREGDDIVSDDADADVVKLIVGEGSHVSLIF